MGAVGSLLAGKDTVPKVQKPVDPFRLTKRQTAVSKMINSRVVCSVDKKTLVITIQVTDQDPLVCATMADSVQERLQTFITDYRTSKARKDLEYNQKLYVEAKHEYDKARQLYATFTDANQDLILQSVRTRQVDLENEMQLKFNTYNAIAAQLQAAKAKVQEETPAFTTLQSATVPIQPSGPKRKQIVMIALFLAFSSATLVTAQIRAIVTGERVATISHVTAAVELTSLITLTQLINSAMAIRGIRKELKKQGKSNAA